MKRIAIAVGVVFGVVFVAAFAFLTVQMDADAHLARRLMSEGEHLTANVASRSIEQRRDGGGRRRPHYTLVLDGTSPSGRTFHESWEVGQATYEQSPEGAAIEVVIAPDDVHAWLTAHALASRDESGHAPDETFARVMMSFALALLASIAAGIVASRVGRRAA